MPGLPLVVNESSNLGGNCSLSRSVDQMCRQASRAHLTAEEAVAAEESLSIYCKPVELYNIVQRRAVRNPLFLQRCLKYKIQVKRKRRIQLTISLPGNMNNGEQVQKLLPLYVLLVTAVSDYTVEENSAVYKLRHARMLTAVSNNGCKNQTEASFVIPEMKKLSADGKASNLTILLLTCGETSKFTGESDMIKEHLDIASFSSNFEGCCLWGKLQVESLYFLWENSASFSLGSRAETLSSIDMQSSFLKPGFLEEDNCLMFQTPHSSGLMGSIRVQVNVAAQEMGAKERSPYDFYAYDDVPTSSLSHIMRLRSGNVIFNYRYYNNRLHMTEVTEDFTCPFCLVGCGSFKGLRCHLNCSHDLFNFEFWVTEEYQAVNVSVKTDTWRDEIVADGIDPRLQTFSFCSKSRKRKRLKTLVVDAKLVHPHVLKLGSPEEARECSCEGSLEKVEGTSSSRMPIAKSSTDVPSNAISPKKYVGLNKGEKSLKAIFNETHMHERHKSESRIQMFNEPVASSTDKAGAYAAIDLGSTGNNCGQPASGNNLAAPVTVQCGKARKLSAERADPRNRALLQRRQFFHSHRAQPMVIDQVLSDHDSEDEVDDDVADFEDQRMLDDFVDVTKDEKQIMHLWNSFVRKQRVLADGHIPWACEAFSKQHGWNLVQAPALMWCWRLLMIKLWNHSLLDARTINNCNLILEGYQKETSDPTQH